MIVGRTARDTIRNPITDETIVSENQIITNEIADALKELKLESVRVRSPPRGGSAGVQSFLVPVPKEGWGEGG